MAEMTEPVESIAAMGPGVGAFVARHMDTTFRRIMGGPRVTFERGFMRLVTGEPHPFGNFVLMSAGATAEGVEDAIGPLLEVPAPSAVLLVDAAAADVDATLMRAGFGAPAPMPAMAVEIEKIAATRLPAEYSFAELGAGFSADQWCEVFADGYELPRPVGTEFGPQVRGVDSTLRYFAILKGQELVSTSIVHLRDGVAGIYGVATLPSERGKGLGACVTAEPLQIAQKMGYRVGVLQSSEAGHPVYLRLGFVDLGALPLYVRMPG
ncbi:MAG: GNAT family N-acetyltransferase [Phycisphaeraceae bacterium]|nr:GNAT family N-acetyltransferase [Phycisphaeraceae bacterium]